MKKIYYLILSLSFITVVLAMDPPQLTGKLADSMNILQATQEWFDLQQSGVYKKFFEKQDKPTTFPQAKILIEKFNQWKPLNTGGDLISKQLYEDVIQKNQQLELVTKGTSIEQLEHSARDPAILNALSQASGQNITKMDSETQLGGTITVFAVDDQGKKTAIATFQNAEQANNFQQIQMALKGQMALTAIHDLSKALEAILQNRQITQKIEEWLNKNIDPKNLTISFDAKAKTAQIKNGQELLYGGTISMVIPLRIAYQVLYAFRVNPSGQKMLGFDPQLAEKIEKLNKTLGTKTIDEAIEYISTDSSIMNAVSKKLSGMKNDVNELKKLTDSLGVDLSKFGEIAKCTILSFQAFMKEMANNTEKSVSGLDDDFRKLNSLLQAGIQAIKSGNTTIPIDVLEDAGKIAVKYEKFDNGPAVNKIKKMLEKQANINKYEQAFIDIYHLKLSKLVSENSVEDKDPLLTIVKTIEIFEDHFKKLTALSSAAKANEGDVSAYFLNNKKEVAAKIKVKEENTYKECLPFYTEEKNEIDTKDKPAILEFIPKPQFAILLLSKNYQQNAYFNFQEMKDRLPFLDEKQKKAVYAYLYEIKNNFNKLVEEYKFMSRLNTTITTSMVQDLFIAVKNSLGEKSKTFITPSGNAKKDYDILKAAINSLISGEQRRTSLQQDIGGVLDDIGARLIGISEAGLDNFISANKDPEETQIATRIKSNLTKLKNILVSELDNIISELKQLAGIMEKSTSFNINLGKQQQALGNVKEEENLKTVFNSLKEKITTLVGSSQDIIKPSNNSVPPPIINLQSSSKSGPPPINLLLDQQANQGQSQGGPPSIIGSLLQNQLANKSSPTKGNGEKEAKATKALADGLDLANKYLIYFSSQEGQQAIADKKESPKDMVDLITNIKGTITGSNMVNAGIAIMRFKKEITTQYPLPDKFK